MCKFSTFVTVVITLFLFWCGQLFFVDLSEVCEDCRLCDEYVF